MATITSVQSGDWSAAGTWDAGVPGDGDAVVIADGHDVKFDVDQSEWEHGLQGVTVASHATDPGMLYWKHDAAGDYILKIRTGYHLQGNADGATRGRILANSDGEWGNDGVYPYECKAIIQLEGTAQFKAEYLDYKMLCEEPTDFFVECYGTSYGPAAQATDVNTTTGVIDWGEPPPAANTAVRVRSADTLPNGLTDHDIYYVYDVDGNTCKLALRDGEAATVVIPSNAGSGDLTLYDGFVAGSATVKVLQDVTGDNWEVGDAVVLADTDYPYDAQRMTISAIYAETIVLTANVSGDKGPLDKLFLSTMNCSVLSSGTSSTQGIIDGGSGGTLGAIRNTTGSGRGIDDGTDCTATTISGCNAGIYDSTGCTATTISGCYTGINHGTGCTATTISGCHYGFYDSTGCTATTVEGAFYAIDDGTDCTATTIRRCAYGFRNGVANTATTISGCGYGIDESSGCTATTISGCHRGIYDSTDCTATTISGCVYGFRESSATLRGTTFTDNTYDLYDAGPCVLHGCSLQGSTQSHGYNETPSPRFQQVSYDPVDASDTMQQGRILAWMSGGICASKEDNVPDDALPWCHLFTFEDADFPVWVDVRDIRLLANQAITIPVYVKCTQTPSGMEEHPSVQLIDPNERWDSTASKLVNEPIANTTDWQTVNLQYTPTEDQSVYVRVRGTNASGTLYWYVDPQIFPTPAEIAAAMWDDATSPDRTVT